MSSRQDHLEDLMDLEQGLNDFDILTPQAAAMVADRYIDRHCDPLPPLHFRTESGRVWEVIWYRGDDTGIGARCLPLDRRPLTPAEIDPPCPRDTDGDGNPPHLTPVA